MHRVTLYYHDHEGHRDLDRPLAYITVDDDAKVEIRMERDDSVLFSNSLENLGYQLLWSGYPVTAPSLPPARPGVYVTDWCRERA